MTHDENVHVTKEQLEILDLAAPLAKYMADKDMLGGVVTVTMHGAALYWEGFTAKYEEDFTKVVPPL